MSGVALLSARFPPAYRGGAEEQAAGLAARLAERHDVMVLTRDGADARVRAAAAAQGFEVVPRGVRPRALRPFVDARTTLRGLAERRERIDVVIAYQVYIDGVVGALARRRLGLPLAVWIRGEGEIRDDYSPKTRWASGRVLAAADLVIAQSERLAAAATAYLADHGRRPRRPVRVIGNGVDLDAGAGAGGPREGLLFVGRLVERKGVDVLLDALAPGMPPLTIVGDGPERAALERRAATAGVPARFRGELDPPAIRAAMARAAALVLPARHGEGVPNVVLEALAAGLPVVATASGGVADVLRDGENGLLVEPGDPAALRVALRGLLDDPRRAARLAEAGRRTAEGHGWDRVVTAVESAVAELAGRRAP